jgi:hypothetical protein
VMTRGSTTGVGASVNSGLLQIALSGCRVAKLNRSATAEGFGYLRLWTGVKSSDSGG